MYFELSRSGDSNPITINHNLRTARHRNFPRWLKTIIEYTETVHFNPMTFIISIQLEDSILVAADRRHTTVKEDGTYTHRDDQESKIYAWKRGIITGSGETTVIDRAIEFFIKLADSKIETLPKCLTASRLLRELEVEHYQVHTTKLLYSDYTATGVQCYTIEPDGYGAYEVKACIHNEILLWLFDPNIDPIIQELKALYTGLKPYKAFPSAQDCINYYLEQFIHIYKKQSKQDPLMSSSFDYFFQTGDDFLCGHIPNLGIESVEKA